METKTVYCPILDKQVDGPECFEIAMASEGLGSINMTLDDGRKLTDDMKATCLSCEWHAK